MLVRLSEFPFCQRLWDLTNHRDDIAVADMEVHMVADMEVDKVADMVTDMVTDMAADKKKLMYARKQSWCMHENEVDVCTKTKLMYNKVYWVEADLSVF